MSIFLTPVQTAIYNRLVAQISSAQVFDDVPGLPEGKPDSDFPYIVIGEDTGAPWDTDDVLGSQVFIMLHVWSRYEGKKQAKEIMSDIYNALNRQAPNLVAVGFRFVDCLFDFAEVFDENDGVTRHGVCRFKLTVEKE